MNLARLVREHLVSMPPPTGQDGDQLLERRHTRCVQTVQLFYLISLYWVIGQMRTWPDLRETTVINPLWPAEWLNWAGTQRGITIVLVVYAVAAGAAALVPQWRLARIAYAFGLLQYEAVVNGFGKAGHGMLAWVWISAVLVLLPGGKASWRRDAGPDRRRTFADVVRLSQFVVLFFYTLTGFWKVYYATLGLFDSSGSAFNVNGFSYILAEALERTGRNTLFGEALVNHPPLAWVLYTGTMYLETLAVLIVFRPRLHRLWGAGLIAFHIGTQVALGVLFPSSVLLLGLFLFFSPVAPEEVRVKEALLDLPGVHFISRLAARSRGDPLVS